MFHILFRLSKLLLAVVLSVYGVQAGKDVDDKTMTKLLNYGLCAQCWGEEYAFEYMKSIAAAGEKCGASVPAGRAAATLMSYPATMIRGMMPALAPGFAPAYTSYYSALPLNTIGAAGRKKRGALSEYSVSAADAMMAMEKMETMVGNFTCVMKELGLLTADGQVNTQVFSHSDDLGAGFVKSGTKAGADPVFLQKLTAEMGDCNAVANSWPQQSLNRNPFMARYGRMAIYFMCIKKVERQNCAKYLMAEMFEAYGIDYDIPMAADRYDGAAMAAKIMEKKASPEEIHIDDYFWGDMDM